MGARISIAHKQRDREYKSNIRAKPTRHATLSVCGIRYERLLLTDHMYCVVTFVYLNMCTNVSRTNWANTYVNYVFVTWVKRNCFSTYQTKIYTNCHLPVFSQSHFKLKINERCVTNEIWNSNSGTFSFEFSK